MPGQLFDGVRVSVASAPGTGAITVGSGYLGVSFSTAGVPNNYVGSYRLDDAGGLWEYGLGSYNSGTGVWTRSTIIASSSGTSAINATSAAILSLVALRRDLRTVLASVSGSSVASLGDNTVVTPEFDTYEVEFLTLIPASSSTSLLLQVYANGAWQTANYSTIASVQNQGGAGSVQPTNGIPLNYTGQMNNAEPGLGGRLLIQNCNDTNSRKIISGLTAYSSASGGGFGYFNTSGYWNGTSAASYPIRGFRVVEGGGGNISGRVKIIGVP